MKKIVRLFPRSVKNQCSLIEILQKSLELKDTFYYLSWSCYKVHSNTDLSFQSTEHTPENLVSLSESKLIICA